MKNRKHFHWIWTGAVAALIGLLVLLWPAADENDPHQAGRQSESGNQPARSRESARSHPRRNALPSLKQQPAGVVAHLYDRAPDANRFLLAKGRDRKFVPNSDAPSGMDLWFQDQDGRERLISDSVIQARFSPDGSKVAYITSDALLLVEDLQGQKLGQFAGAYGASWKPDGSEVIFSRVGEGQDPHRPGTRSLATLDLTTGRVQALTDGRFDDGRPEYHPSGKYVLFVSGARTGLASFWQVPSGGGEPRQVTNIGLQQVNSHFVPPPYERTTWSADQRWFVYDVKSGDQQETWGLEFNHDGTLKRSAKLADGINPRWQDATTVLCDKHVDGRVETVFGYLP